MWQEEQCRRQKERPMLVLCRKPQESIFIDENVVVTVLSVRGTRVRLGIEAPSEMPVHRQEVHEAIRNRKVLTTLG
jgi:carbon storage regulator